MNNNLVKTGLENGGRIIPLIIPFEQSAGTGQMNPSLLLEDDRILINLRHVQYILLHAENKERYNSAYGPVSHNHPDNDRTLKTTNYLFEMDYDLNVTRIEKVNTSLHDINPVWEFIGLEDARLVKWNDKLYQIGVRRDTKPNGEGRMEFSEIEIRQNKVKEINRTRIEPPGEPTYCEKNWMPVLDMHYHFVKWTNPTEVVKVDLHSKKSETVFKGQQFECERDLRGGSQVVTYGDYRIAITHEVDLWSNVLGQKDGAYFHRVIIWNKDWTILSKSQPFKFMDGGVEFCCGLAIKDEKVFITFGFQDNIAYLLEMPVKLLFENVITENKITANNLIEKYVFDTRGTEANYKLAMWYFEQKHYAGAISHFIRAAEYSTEFEYQVYDSLCYIAICLREIDNRRICEKGYINHAIAYDPNRPEAYLLLSQWYEVEKNWHDCYSSAVVGLSKRLEPTIIECETYKLMFQKAVSSWWIGRFEESREIFFSMPDMFETMEQKYINLIQNNMNFLGIGNYPFLTYTSEHHDRLRCKFSGSEKIETNFSQVMQDMFVLMMHNGKREGFYLEIGAADPVKGNNTYLLEKQFDWNGISIEISEAEVAKWKGARNNRILCRDASVINYDLLLKDSPKVIDYLQLDCEPPGKTFEILQSIPFDTHDFVVITYEHDYYADASRSYREKSRQFLFDRGYDIIAGNISADETHPFEDWWFNPGLIDEEIVKQMIESTSETKRADTYILI